jgi:PEGA domain-containing protein
MFVSLLAALALNAPNVVIVDSKLGAQCLRPDRSFPVVESSGPLDTDLEKQRNWIAEAKVAWNKGRQLELELESEQAEYKLEEALALFGRGAPALDDFSDYARTLIDLGAVFAEAHKDDAAAQAFRRATVLEISAQPNGKEYPPEVIKRFKKVTEQLAREPRSSVAVTGKPEGAEVFWDGHHVGQIPVSISDALPGEHWLTALAPDHKRFSTLVTIAKRAEHVEVFMQKLGENTSREQFAIASAEHTGPPTPRELSALTELSGTSNTNVIVLARDPHVASGCAAQYRVFLPNEGASGVQRVALAAPFNLSDLPSHPTAPAEQPLALNATAPRVSAGLAWLPLGIPQFIEHRPGPAAALLGTQVALLATNLTCYYVAQNDRQRDGTYNNAGRVQALQAATDVAVGLLIVDVIAGAIDGLLHR